MIRLDQLIILIGAIAMLLPLGEVTVMGGLILIGALSRAFSLFII